MTDLTTRTSGKVKALPVGAPQTPAPELLKEIGRLTEVRCLVPFALGGSSDLFL